MMINRLLPEDINAEVLLNSGLVSPWRVRPVGTHRRNATGDIERLTAEDDAATLLSLGRNSIYDTLPEAMFHPIDRFDTIPESRKDELFADEVMRQERERDNARRFFLPVDALLFSLRLEVRERIERLVAGGNMVLQNIIGDCLTTEERDNPYVRGLIPLLPYCRHIRGNRTLITLALRKALGDECVTLTVNGSVTPCHDDDPRYAHTVDSPLDECFAGNDFDDNIVSYRINYRDNEACDRDFRRFVRDIEVLRTFVERWFLAVDRQLEFDLGTIDSAVRLNDESHGYYLNYNTNL